MAIRRTASSFVSVLGSLLVAPYGTAAADVADPSACRVSKGLLALADLPEASGVAASRAHPGVLWSIVDSGEPQILALDTKGTTKGRVTIAGAQVRDWEDLAVGPCGKASCVYVADIGDNRQSRRRITIYRVPEPSPGDSTTRPAEAFHAMYPDGPHDAESIFVTPAGDLFLVTKESPATVYRFPQQMNAGSTSKLQHVGQIDRALSKERLTGAAASPDGRWVVLRTHKTLAFYHADAIASGRTSDAVRVDVSSLGEPQGEGVTWAADGNIYLAGEGGGSGRAGTLAHVVCTRAQ